MSAADRARLRRDRVRRLVTVVPVEVDFAMIDAMIDAGQLSAAASDDRQALGRAIGRVLNAWKNTVTRDASERSCPDSLNVSK